MESHLPVYSAEELARRNGVSSDQVWVAYQGRIYDVTHSKLFRDGRHFRHVAGCDLTAEMDAAPHTERVFADFTVVGLLK